MKIDKRTLTTIAICGTCISFYIGAGFATMQKSWSLREFCVSNFRQNQEYHVFNVQDEGLFPLVTSLPEGWDGMRAVCGVNAVPAFRESYFRGISLPCGRRT